MAFVSPLDLETWFVGTFSGSISIFVAVMFLFVSGLAAYFRMPTSITLVSFGLFVLMMGSYTGDIFVLFVILLALAGGAAIGWFWKR